MAHFPFPDAQLPFQNFLVERSWRDGCWASSATAARGPVVLGRAMLMMLVILVLPLSTVRVCEALPKPGQHHGLQWVWGVAEQVQDEAMLLTRRKRAEGQQPNNTEGHSHTASTAASSHGTDSLTPDLMPAPSTSASWHQALAALTTADLLDETDSSEPDLLISSAPAPSANTKLHQAPVAPTTANPQDETNVPNPDLMMRSMPPPALSANTSWQRVLTALSTADPLDETDSPDPDLMLSSTSPPVPSANTSLHRAPAVPTTADLQDETNSPEPDLLPSSAPPTEPSTRAAPHTSIASIPSRLTSPSEEGTLAGSTDSSSNMGSHSVTLATLSTTTMGYKKVRKYGTLPMPTRSVPWDMKPWGTAAPVPWDLNRVMSKCLLAILLLALVAAIFMVCTGVLGALLWRQKRTAHRRLSPTEMVCISSLLPDGEVATNGPKPGPARRTKLLLDGGSEPDGDNLTLSSFLPEHS
ncbi:P-selectin glycoprotein ligand 1 [Porphyrio hochstetteri]